MVEIKYPLISIIVPVYNVEEYLVACVHSLVNQTYQNIQIILVDDGSLDHSPELCDMLAREDDRISVIHQKNSGLSAARNVGIRMAKGLYIGFVDSDDSVLSTMYEKLYEAMAEKNADLVICDYQSVTPQGYEIEEYSPIKKEVLSAEEAYSRILGDDGYWHYVTAVNKLYKRCIFDNLCFNEGRVHEDEFSIHHIFSKCNKIVTIPDKLYIYLRREHSITTNSINEKSLDAVYALHDRYLFFSKMNMKGYAHRVALTTCGIFLELLKKINNKCYHESVNAVFRIVLKDMFDVHEVRIVKLIAVYILYSLRCQSRE